eukprot:SRR837773.6166.p2 GENE.SRR837773.6166~~SRR837773.6166.p2  ORF type:complete len:185 (-),score=42.93 SRR837773.6166:293-847(-)
MEAAKASMSLAEARAAQAAIRELVAAARGAGRLEPAEADDLRETLESEVNLEFGARHEDAALAAFAATVQRPVYGEQRRVSVPLPLEGAEAALGTVFPTPHSRCLSALDAEKAAAAAAEAAGGALAAEAAAAPKAEPYFRLTGFVDALVDLPRATAKRRPRRRGRRPDGRGRGQAQDGENQGPS